ncbi:DUF2155 domain-containing protein [Rhodobacteraceae bacterium IMCC1335]|jgi:hypothetical protein
MRFGFFGFLIGFAIFPQDGQAQSAVQTADGAVLRGLDKVSGDIQDFPLRAGSSFDLGALNVALSECRYPVDNPMGDAFAYITISEDPLQPPVFMGWMVASSPALNPLDHRRYDVWVLRCAMSEASTE